VLRIGRQLRHEGLTITLSTYVFIPTAETFGLIALARKKIAAVDPSAIADIGTGTGIIALALAKAFPNKQVFAKDTSDAAVQLAQQNAKQNSISNIQFFRNAPDRWISAALPAPIDCIVANPPYIGDEEYTAPEFLQHYPEAATEPPEAIRTYDTLGIRPYVRILKESRRLKTNWYVFQCNVDYLEKLRTHIESLEFTSRSFPDSSGRDRYLILKQRYIESGAQVSAAGTQ
jgi:release factor glutamine methyltransferase